MKTRSIVGLVVLALLLSGGDLCAQTIAYKDPSAPVEARVKPGQFELSVGSSSRPIRFSQQVVLSK
ncbi:hypothetical protein D4R75_06240 [bacterium]|nr:MAG: hypothetical protein D4R75_06240 [bacterium]